jgi:hypothetical protein
MLPVTLTRKVPAVEPLTVNLSVTDVVVIVTLGLARVAVTPAGADTARFTVPVNPLTGATVIVEFWLLPGANEIEAGEAETVKSVTFRETVAVREVKPV